MSKLKNKGFTLIELLYCTAILSIILIPLLNTFTLSLKNNKDAEVKSKTTDVAKSVMEYYKSNKNSGDMHISSFNKLKKVIFDIVKSSDTGSYATIYVFHNSEEDLVNSLNKYDFSIKGEGREDFEGMKNIGLRLDFDYAIKIILTVKEARIIKIDIAVWDRIQGEKSKVNLISLKGGY
ncbi:hypothetical protein OXPF_14110 [Oxobacter pfennigii]|uniref:Prepilin-type N-terminal cleavage/methylation domain-containing protein n=1 Tax=Oxobacter pfennigii TaxID=36849 RepID=A0A0P9AHI4_9CLOT|nr:prepilin-type N-terminal cleavage/methylation domain-containing protein [Oxobacter pfennigii]KPU44933.1 hypothetical protein OXPF_14110 [Oxobacter pfennigii]